MRATYPSARRERRRSPAPLPCGPAAPAPSVPDVMSRRATLRFGLRDRVAAILQDVRDVKQDAPGLLRGARAFAHLAQAEDRLRAVLNDLEAAD